DLSRVDHSIATPSDVDEGGLHRRQNVLDAAQVDVADQGSMCGAVDIVLDEDVILEYGDLNKIIKLPDDHLAPHRFAPCEELSLAQHRRAAPTGLPTFASPLPLGLHPG